MRSELDWPTMFGAFREAFEWTLDVAKDLARDYPDEVAAVERVRSFMHAQVAGRDAHIRADDVLFTLALVVGAIERDLGPLDLREPRFGETVALPAEWDESGNFRVRFAGRFPVQQLAIDHVRTRLAASSLLPVLGSRFPGSR